MRVIGKPKTMQKKADAEGVNYRVNKQGGLILNDDNDESRRFVEQCYRTTSTMVNPIVDWTDEDVWDFLHHYGCSSNPLYDSCGFKRIGCIGCPMATYQMRHEEFERYPKYRRNYVHAFDRMLEERQRRGKETYGFWKNGESVMQWWIGDLKD